MCTFIEDYALVWYLEARNMEIEARVLVMGLTLVFKSEA